MRWGDGLTTLTVVTFGLSILLMGVLVVAVAIEPVRPVALGFAGVLLLARLITGFLRIRESRRTVAQLKSENGGALPIPNPRRARILFVSFSATFAVLGAGALVLAAFAGWSDRIFLVVFGITMLTVATVFAVTGRRMFRARAAADRAAAARPAPPA